MGVEAIGLWRKEGSGVEDGGDAADGGEEGVDFGCGVVDGEGGAYGAGNAEALHKGLGTVVTGAHRHTHLVQQDADIVGVLAVDQEAEHGTFVIGGAVDGDVADVAQARLGAAQQGDFVLLHLLEADAVDEVEGLAEGGDVDEVRGAGLELEGQFGEGGAGEADVVYHLAAALVGGHLLEPFLLAVQHTDAAGAVHLMAGEGVEVGVEVAYVDAQVGCCLSAVDEHWHALGVGVCDHLLDGVDCAEHVGDVTEGGEDGSVVEEAAVLAETQLAAVVDVDDAQPDSGTGLQELPRHYVGVVLHDGEDYFVALFET